MTEKIAALAFVFVFALLFSIVVLGLLTAYRDRSSGLSAGSLDHWILHWARCRPNGHRGGLQLSELLRRCGRHWSRFRCPARRIRLEVAEADNVDDQLEARRGIEPRARQEHCAPI
jgi:hypothetical protein